MKKGGTSQHWRRTQKKRIYTNLFKNNKLPIPLHFNKLGIDSAKFDVESQISSIELICLKKPYTRATFEKIKQGYILQNQLSKQSDYICKIYQAAYSNRDFYIWQEKGISLKAYIIEHPAEKTNRLQEASSLVERLWNEHKIQYTDLSTDNFIIINNKIKLIDFEHYSKLKSDSTVVHESPNVHGTSPRQYTSTPRLHTSSPKPRTSTRRLRTSSPKPRTSTRRLRTSSPT